MKIKITDLLDHYYENTVTLAEPEMTYSTVMHSPPKKKTFSMHKPMLIAASLLLVLCGIFVLNLGTGFSGSGTALSEGVKSQPSETMAEHSEIPEAFSALEAVPSQSPETNPARDDYDPYEESEHQLLVAELNLPLTLGDHTATLLNLTLDMTYGDYIWYYTAPTLNDALYNISPEGDLSEALYDSDFNQSTTEWDNRFLEYYWSDAVIHFSDGSTYMPGSGDVIGFSDGVFSTAGGFLAPCESAGIDLDTAYPVSVTMHDVTYDFVETTAIMTDPTPTLDIPAEAEPDYAEPQEETAAPETDNAVIFGNSTSVHPAAVDENSDGILTIALNIKYEFQGSPAYLAVFTIDRSADEYTWYNSSNQMLVLLSEMAGSTNPTSEDFSDIVGDADFNQTYTDWNNQSLEQYKANAYLVYTDGTKVCLGSGDKVGFDEEGGLFWDAGKLSWLEDDYNVDLSNLEISHLEICGEMYYFN